MFPGRREYLFRHWRWWYRAGFAPGIEPLAVIHDGEMIGQAGVIPVELQCGSQRLTAIWFLDFAVLPAYQGQGLGKRLTEAWMRMCGTQITYCNDKSIRVFLKYGWKEKFDTARCAAPLKLASVLRTRTEVPAVVKTGAFALEPFYRLWLRGRCAGAPRLRPEPVKNNDAALLAIYREGDRTTFGLVRDEAWIRWRILESPFVEEYQFFRHEKTAALVRAFCCEGIRRVHILWIGGAAVAAQQAELMRGIAKWAIGQGAELIWTTLNDPELTKRAHSILPRQNKVRFAFFSSDPALSERFSKETFPLYAVDTDLDLDYVTDPVS